MPCKRVRHPPEMVQSGEERLAQAYIEGLAETPEGQAVLQAMERALSDAMGRMGPGVGGPDALRLFQNLKAMIEPFVRY